MTTREDVVKEALTWVGTPYMHRQLVKGPHGGCDCATSLYAWFYNAGAIPEIVIPEYSAQWHMHRDEPRYLEHVMQYGVELDMTEEKLPADVILYRYGRQFAHAALIVAWPTIIQAAGKAKAVILDDAVKNMGLNFSRRGTPIPQKLFRLKAWV